MAYYSGVANDMAEVRQALIDSCVGEDWVWNSSNEVLYKNGVFFHLSQSGNYLRLRGRTSLINGNAPNTVQVGAFTVRGQNAMTFPISYEVFVFEAEVYLVINYNVEFYQYLAFGRSTINVPGSGCWFAGTAGGVDTSYSNGNRMTGSGGSNIGRTLCVGIMWRNYITGMSAGDEYGIHSDLDAGGWGAGRGNFVSSAESLVPLLLTQPNVWNSEAILLPVRAYGRRLEGKISLIADLQHIRITRNDNLEPGQVIEIGFEKWKVFPCYRKNAAVRDSTTEDSGTFAHAIRYDGP